MRATGARAAGTRVAVAAACVVTALAAPASRTQAQSAPALPAEYRLVELGDLGAGASVTAASETRGVLRAAGHARAGTYRHDASGSDCPLSVPVIWDVTGAASPLAPLVLPSPVPGKPARVVAVSPDGAWLGGIAWASDASASACAYEPQPVAWGPDGHGGWTAVTLPPPPGHVRGWVTGITDGGAVAFGDTHWPTLMPDGTTRWASRPVVWRRTPDGSFAPEPLPCGGCGAEETQGVRADGAVASGGVRLDGADESAPHVPVFWEHGGAGWAMQELRTPSADVGGIAWPGVRGSFYGRIIAAGAAGGHAVVWESSAAEPTDLHSTADTAGASRAADQNGAGVLVGHHSVVVRRTAEAHAVRWTPPGWQMEDLNTLLDTGAWTLQYAVAIDGEGRITGSMTRVLHGQRETGSFVLLPLGR